MNVTRSGNQIELLCTGAALFPAMVAAIDAAQSEVRLETYIYANDASGRLITAALCRAARRGVRVHVVVDGFGSPRFMAGFGHELQAAGAEVFVYRPEIARFRFRRHRLRRLHRKLACMDACVAFVGGINIIDDIDPGQPEIPRLDYAVRVSGPLLTDIHKSMCHLWSLLRWANLGKRYAAPPPHVICLDSNGHMQAEFLVRDSIRHRRDIEEAYLEAIAAARQEVLIANAYFLPGRRFRHALMDAAARGVNVTLLIQGRVEYRLLHYASQAGYAQLIAAGVHIHEYHKSYLHAKVAIIDGHWSTVGSSNIDPFSLLLAREANVVIEDAGFAAQLQQSVQQAMAEGGLAIPSIRHLPLYRRLFGWFAYGMARAMLGLSGYGRNF